VRAAANTLGLDTELDETYDFSVERSPLLSRADDDALPSCAEALSASACIFGRDALNLEHMSGRSRA
jgi:hypothetical protein